MNRDLKEALMIISREDITQFEALSRISTENFLIKYKLFIDELEHIKEKANK